MLKTLRGGSFAKDTATGDVYLLDGTGGKMNLTGTLKVASIASTTQPTTVT